MERNKESALELSKRYAVPFGLYALGIMLGILGEVIENTEFDSIRMSYDWTDGSSTLYGAGLMNIVYGTILHFKQAFFYKENSTHLE